MVNRRSEPRFPADQPVTVHITSSSDSQLQLDGTIAGFSRSGVMLQTDAKIARGSAIKISWPRATITGTVRYCRRKTAEKYAVGVKITELLTKQGTPVTAEVA